MDWEGSRALRLDAKGRFVVPVDLRTALLPAGASRLLTITRHFEEECLCVFQDSEWQIKRAQFLSVATSTRGDQLMIRRFISQAVSVELDGHWRFTVPSTLRDQAQLAVREDFMLVGVRSHLELWHGQHFEEAISAALPGVSAGFRQTLSYPTDDSVPADES